MFTERKKSLPRQSDTLAKLFCSAFLIFTAGLF